MGYGLRTLSPGDDISKDNDSHQRSKASKKFLLDGLMTYPVPHRYFAHFYVLSVTSSLFWGCQIVTQGLLLQVVSQCGSVFVSKRSMSLEQIALCWSLLAIQGIRRLYEAVTLYETSKSTMSFSHYLLGMAFYVVVGISIWIEGAGMLTNTGPYQFFHVQSNPR